MVFSISMQIKSAAKPNEPKKGFLSTDESIFSETVHLIFGVRFSHAIDFYMVLHWMVFLVFGDPHLGVTIGAIKSSELLVWPMEHGNR